MHAVQCTCNKALCKARNERTVHRTYLTTTEASLRSLIRDNTPVLRRHICVAQTSSRQTLRRRKRCLAHSSGAVAFDESCAIRNFRETDAEAVVQLQSTVFYDAWGSEWIDKALFGFFQAEVRSIVQQKLKMEDDSFQCILAVSHNTASKPVAVVEVSLQSNQEVLRALAAGAGETYAYVACMAVQEDFRRQGIALQLLKAAERQARAWKQEVLALHVYKTNDVALKAYEKAGYTLLQVDGAWRAMLGAKQRILMYKSL